MKTTQLRTPGEADWPAILGLADAALPWDASGNREWLENRMQFAGRRRHYLAEQASPGFAIGYGAAEEGPEPGIFRLFVVMDPALLLTETGDLVYDRLAADLVDLEARLAWVREYADDTAILAFFAQKGFVERNRFTLPGHREMVVLMKPLKK
jgi:hypothetical protein